jgi:hypothetical protein
MQVQCLMKTRIARHANSEGRIEGQMCVRLVGPRDASKGWCGLTFARPANGTNAPSLGGNCPDPHVPHQNPPPFT